MLRKCKSILGVLLFKKGQIIESSWMNVALCWDGSDERVCSILRTASSLLKSAHRVFAYVAQFLPLFRSAGNFLQ